MKFMDKFKVKEKAHLLRAYYKGKMYTTIPGPEEESWAICHYDDKNGWYVENLYIPDTRYSK